MTFFLQSIDLPMTTRKQANALLGVQKSPASPKFVLTLHGVGYKYHPYAFRRTISHMMANQKETEMNIDWAYLRKG